MSVLDPNAKERCTEHSSIRNPIEWFQSLWQEAKQLQDPNAPYCSLATVQDNKPSVRVLVLREVTDEGFLVFINDTSPKWQHLVATGHYELLIFWPSLMRQVRVSGGWEVVAKQEMEQHWRRLPKASQLLAHYYDRTKHQSDPVASKEALEQGIRHVAAQFAEGGDMPYCDTARGVRFLPTQIEFWKNSPEDRLHERIMYSLQNDATGESAVWKSLVLVP